MRTLWRLCFLCLLAAISAQGLYAGGGKGCRIEGCKECSPRNNCTSCNPSADGSDAFLSNNKCFKCSSVSGDKHCKVCHKNALGLNLKTNKQECRRCMPFARNGDGAKVAVHKNKQGRCNPCNKCPYKEGWAGCDDKGRCTKCRTKDGFTQTESGKCLKSACAVPVRPGPCKAAIPRWYYNSEAGECVRFTYGGCQGNANNFPTELDCKRACMPCMPVMCLVPPCQFHQCPVGQACRDDYCYGCDAVCEPCKKSNCPVVPCTVAKLACPEGQQCVNDYCNCAARCGISPEEVPGCKNPVPCLVAPCEFNNPCAADELCVDDYCGGCFARCRKQES